MSSIKIRRQALAQLENEDGRVTPDQLVEAAADPTHPLHGDFTWDNAAAAHQHRLHQARTIISSVRVKLTVGSQMVTVVAYVRDPEAGSAQGYRSIVRVRSEHDVAVEALLAEIARVAAILERAVGIASALDLEAEFQAGLDNIKVLHNLVKAKLEEKELEDA